MKNKAFIIPKPRGNDWKQDFYFSSICYDTNIGIFIFSNRQNKVCKVSNCFLMLTLYLITFCGTKEPRRHYFNCFRICIVYVLTVQFTFCFFYSCYLSSNIICAPQFDNPFLLIYLFFYFIIIYPEMNIFEYRLPL